MDNKYTTIESIKSEFSINDDDIEVIRSKLRSKQISIHPDKNGGVFTNDEDEKYFHKLSKAIEFIDSSEKKNALVSVSAVTDLTKAVTELVKSQSSTKNNALSEQVSSSIESYKSRLKLPKIALSIISIAVTAIWLFPNTVKEHPVLSKWIDFSDQWTNVVWIYILFTAVAFWLLTWRNEERQKHFQESLKTELVQNRLFLSFIKSLESSVFTLEDFVEHITTIHSHTHNSPLFLILGSTRKIDMPMAHTIADVIIERAVSRKALIPESTGKMSTEYRVNMANK